MLPQRFRSQEGHTSYDRDGNVLFKNNVVNGSFSELYHANSSSSADNNKAYDNLNRIIDFRRGTLSASANNGGVLDTVSTLNTLANSSQSWSLDNIGNWNSLTTDGTLQTNTFDDQNEQTHAGSNTLGFDYNGNTTTDDQGRTLVYDAWNHLVAVKNGATTLASYGFDAGGNRIIQTENGVSADLYVTAAGQVIEERQGATVTAQYVWGLMYVNDLILRDDNSTSGNLGKSGSGLGRRLYVQQDANWNATAVAGSNGAVGERFVYSPYGVRTVLSSTWTTTTDAYGFAYTFQGMRFDPATGLLHAQDRDDSPVIGRWIQRDLGYIDGANLYEGLGSNPVTYVDPLGEYWSVVGKTTTTLASWNGGTVWRPVGWIYRTIGGKCHEVFEEEQDIDHVFMQRDTFTEVDKSMGPHISGGLGVISAGLGTASKWVKNPIVIIGSGVAGAGSAAVGAWWPKGGATRTRVGPIYYDHQYTPTGVTRDTDDNGAWENCPCGKLEGTSSVAAPLGNYPGG